jgi:protein TonB
VIKTIVILLSLCWGFSALAQDHCVPPNPGDSTSVIRDSTIIDGTVVYLNPDERAQFVGGFTEMKKFLDININIPPVVIGYCNYNYAKVFTQFIVLNDGSILGVKVMRGAPDCPECDTEAVRLIKSMPNWIPAKVNGQAVNSYFNLPIKFQPR